MIVYYRMPHKEVEAPDFRPPYLASNDNRRCHMYAIIATGGKQYKVAEGDVIRVEKLGAEAGETVTFDQVLAVSNDGLKVGQKRIWGSLPIPTLPA